MWIMLNDAFFSIVRKDCKPDELLVRARRPGDIEKVFGRRWKVAKVDVADYLFRATLPVDTVVAVMEAEVRRIAYGNFKDSVASDDLHNAYMDVWTAMSKVQPTAPYSGLRRQRSLFSSSDPRPVPPPTSFRSAVEPEFPEDESFYETNYTDPVKFAYEQNRTKIAPVKRPVGRPRKDSK